jgi:hypothetical protein
MQIDVLVSPTEGTRQEFAKVEVRSLGGQFSTTLDLDFSTVRQNCLESSKTTLDFLFLSSIVYVVDKLIKRSNAQDLWTRDLELNIPLLNLDLWSPAKRNLESAFSFLTGDNWRINFSQLQHELIRPQRQITGQLFRGRSFHADAACLFSGGLDSLVGAIDWLESNPGRNLLLVSHYDGKIPGPHADQNNLLQILKNHYGQRVNSLQVRVGQNPAGVEKSYRSRSLLFIALGIYAAHAKGESTPLLMPENGNIALNMPLTPSRRGSCSTRTAHPLFLNTIRDILLRLGVRIPLINPFELETKGECVEHCLNQELLRTMALKSRSCAKSGRKTYWRNRQARGCGFCVPCIFRRAALNKINFDTESYGFDICKDDVDLNSPAETGNDLRAVISTLRNNLSREDIASLLLSNGSLDISLLPGYADLIFRALNEVRDLLKSKGTAIINRMARL